MDSAAERRVDLRPEGFNMFLLCEAVEMLLMSVLSLEESIFTECSCQSLQSCFNREITKMIFFYSSDDFYHWLCCLYVEYILPKGKKILEVFSS